MANKPGEANFFPDVPEFPNMGVFQPIYGKFDLTTYIQGASDYEIMAFLVGKYNACLEAYGNITKLSTDTITACKQLQDWINSWFDNLDVQQELNNKIDQMVADGSFGELLHQTFDAQINQQTTNAVTAWLVANVTPTGSAVVLDKSLSIEGAAADAKTTGRIRTCNLQWSQKDIGLKITVGENSLTPSIDNFGNNYWLSSDGRIALINSDMIVTDTYNNPTNGFYGVYLIYVGYTPHITIKPQSYIATTPERGDVLMWFEYVNNTIIERWRIQAVDKTLTVEGAAADAKVTGRIRTCNAQWFQKDIGLKITVSENSLTPSIDNFGATYWLSSDGRIALISSAMIVTDTYNNPTNGFYGVYLIYVGDAPHITIKPQSYIATTPERGDVLMWFEYVNNTVYELWYCYKSNQEPEPETTVNHWAGKQWYAYGTSITNIAGEGRYATYLAELSGLKLTNKGISGGGIVANTRIKNAIMNITDGKLNADLITLELGANDGYVALGDIYDTGDNTFCGALNQCIRYLQQYVPKAQIVVWGSPMIIESSPNSGEFTPPDMKKEPDNHTTFDQRELTRKVCALNGVKYIDMFESCGMGYYRQYYNRNLTQDGVHPSDVGGKNIAEYIWGQLKNVPLWYTRV